MVIKRIGPVSCGKIAGTLYAIVGIVFGGIVSVIALAGGLGANSSRGAGVAAMFGVGAILVLPVLYGGIGFVATLIGAWLYNLVAGLVGGVEVDLQ
jgi:hypothetical protein